MALATPAVAATTPSWRLTNEFASKPVCYTPSGGSLHGTGPYTVNSTSFGEAYAVTDIPAGKAAGSTFNIALWASDGTPTQTESVPVVIKASCARRY